MRIRTLFAAAASSLALACCGSGASGPPPPPPGATAPGAVIGTASIVGRVVLAGSPPPRETLKISDAGCHHEQGVETFTETVVANSDGTLRNVLVHVKSGLGSRIFAPPAPAILDQKGCIYIPHVIGVQVNQLVTFLNSDPTLHNVHSVSKVNRPFNFGMGVQGQRVSRFFSQPEILKMKCDVHSWMSSYIGVFENPFYSVTGDGGRFELRGLPAGTYEIEAWQETYGVQSQSVSVRDGESRSIEFRLGN